MPTSSHPRARITDHWLPFPEDVLTRMGWVDGETLDVEVVGEAVLLTRVASPPASAPKPKAEGRVGPQNPVRRAVLKK